MVIKIALFDSVINSDSQFILRNPFIAGFFLLFPEWFFKENWQDAIIFQVLVYQS